MFRNRAIIYRILRYALVMTIHATAPAYAEQSFDKLAGSWSGSGSVKPSDGPLEQQTIARFLTNSAFPDCQANFGRAACAVTPGRPVAVARSSRR